MLINKVILNLTKNNAGEVSKNISKWVSKHGRGRSPTMAEPGAAPQHGSSLAPALTDTHSSDQQDAQLLTAVTICTMLSGQEMKRSP